MEAGTAPRRRMRGRPAAVVPGLRFLRIYKSLTLSAAARMIPCSISKLSKLERGLSDLQDDLVPALALVYQVTERRIRTSYLKTLRSVRPENPQEMDALWRRIARAEGRTGRA